jgi:hypothetical protein
MKKLILLFFALFIGAGVFAQEVVPDDPAIPGLSFEGIFGTFAALVAAIPVIVQILRNVIFKTASGLVMQVISWIIGLLVALAGWYFKLGFLDGISVWMALAYGAGACLAANGIFDTGIVSLIIDSLFKLFKTKKEA